MNRFFSEIVNLQGDGRKDKPSKIKIAYFANGQNDSVLRAISKGSLIFWGTKGLS